MAPHGIPPLSSCRSNHTHTHGIQDLQWLHAALWLEMHWIMHVYPATHVFICVIVHHTVLHYSVEACSANVLLTASNPQGFLKEEGQKPQCSGTCSSVVKHYWINLHLQWDVLWHCLKAFDLIFTSTAPNLTRHKSSPGGAEEAKPPQGKEKQKSGRRRRRRRRRVGVTVSTKPSYPLDIKALHCVHTIKYCQDDVTHDQRSLERKKLMFWYHVKKVFC